MQISGEGGCIMSYHDAITLLELQFLNICIHFSHRIILSSFINIKFSQSV